MSLRDLPSIFSLPNANNCTNECKHVSQCKYKKSNHKKEKSWSTKILKQKQSVFKTKQKAHFYNDLLCTNDSVGGNMLCKRKIFTELIQ